MTTTSLPLLKAQLNLEHDLDDTLLTHKLAVAEECRDRYAPYRRALWCARTDCPLPRECDRPCRGLKDQWSWNSAF